MSDNNEKETLRNKVEDLKQTVTGKAEELREKAEELAAQAQELAGKAMDTAGKILDDVLQKNEPEEAQFTEEKTDPRDIEIAELKRELDELRDKYVRLYADFDNAKKRMARERLELIQQAAKDIIKDLLPVLDDFERAQKSLENTGDVQAVKEGLTLVHNKLLGILSNRGLKAMESIGKDFDVELHEAITEVPAPTPEQAGKVIDEVEKGYYLHEKIIRFAKVIVGK
ncbi:MAG: nucleotide exchange factor GrpE [Chitinophagales bacterium]|nr:nucleotide exchange factor GrpE [Chitinophagales bacterium]MDW8417967.1 nucleotide exchange factor GrpE [Chitinophagales bacterium]